MTKSLFIAQIILAILLSVAILTQQKGTALGGAFGGDSTVYRTRRGVEKLLYYATILLALLFVATIVGSSLV